MSDPTSFYSPDPSMSSPNSKSSSKYATLDAIDSTSFDPDQYMHLLVHESNLEGLLQRHVEMAAERKNLDTDLQIMKSNIVGMEANMEQLLEKIMSVRSRSVGVNTCLFEKREHIEKLHRTRNLLHKIQFIYDLPARLGKCIKSEAYADAVKFYTGAMPIFKTYGDSSFQDCKRVSEEAGKLFSDSESIQARAEAAVLLKQLDFPECVRGALKNKTVLPVTHQVDFLHNVDLILAGKYNDLLNSGLDFKEPVAAHDTSMELVEMSIADPSKSSPGPQISRQLFSKRGEANDAYRWWGVVVVLSLTLMWQASQMAGDYWLSYETAAKRAASFKPSVFIIVYGLIACVAFVVHPACPHVVFQYYTDSGRILSRASTDQTNMDRLLSFMLGITIAMFFTVFLLIPLAWLKGYFLASSQELTRLYSITKAPENVKRVNANLHMDFHNNGSNEWLGFRLEMLGSLPFCISTMFMILLPSSIIKPENVGLTVSYGLSLNEAAWKIVGCVPPPNWPSRGHFELKDLQVSLSSTLFIISTV
ncbi:ABC transporter C family member 14-like [Pyrus ussuriensis x Pyrus communis]|uniref:Vacuolar protein sorting-associated protein 51 homolog n=1 Tax=Pyrus ussuriensis x Pyrus communis TaxID=2448454 RepID=A0A5N5FTX5_9ROSA|nr:ABC transporter C family member 14-like [Pyrus ussuriensis x Pyrus communis]